ncbi:MAG: hypothetical protein GY722_16340 [bacterium]|nr:hypothetical protein [bacterium]
MSVAGPPGLAQCNEAVLSPASSMSGDRFGARLAIYDGSLAVGSSYLNTPSGNGSVTIFERSGRSWREQLAIYPPHAFTNQRFGHRVALEGATLMIQELTQDPSVAPEGGSAVHVYEMASGAWSYVQRLVDPLFNSPNHINDFGRSIAIQGSEAFIANRREDRIHIFSYASGSWLHDSVITAGDLAPFSPSPSVDFANRVAIDGDTLLAASGSSGNSDPVYVLERDIAGWNATAALDSVPSGRLGPEPAIAIEGDFAYIGSEMEDGQAGKVYVYKRNVSVWTLHQIVRPEPHLTFSRFGHALDVNGDSLVVGANISSVGGTGAGAAYLFRRENGFWAQVGAFIPEQPVPFISLGSSVGVSGNDAAIGASAELISSQGGQVHTWQVTAPIGTAYGDVEPNSTGVPASLQANGILAVDHNCLTLVGTELPPSQFGYFLMSRAQDLRRQFGGSQGNLHLALPIVRFNGNPLLVDSGGEARFEPDFDSLPQGVHFQPGDTWNFQMWYRDANPSPTSNTTNGVAVTFMTTGEPSVQLPVTLAERTEDSITLGVLVTLSQSADHDVIVPYTVSGSAQHNVDWRVEESNPIVIPAGTTSFEMTVIVAEDALQEGDESAVVTLANPTGGALGTAADFTLTIRDDD